MPLSGLPGLCAYSERQAHLLSNFYTKGLCEALRIRELFKLLSLIQIRERLCPQQTHNLMENKHLSEADLHPQWTSEIELRLIGWRDDIPVSRDPWVK